MKLTKTQIDKALPTQKDFFLWDSNLKGFGLKVAKGGRKSFVCKYRVGGGSGLTRRMTIGAYGSPWTVDEARKVARQILGRAANGEDPARERQENRDELSVSDLCDLYLKQGTGTKKPSTLSTDKGRIERHIKPMLGKKKVSAVTRSDIKKFLRDIADGKTATDIKTRLYGRAIVRGGKGTATRTVGLLGGIFSFAVDSGFITDNPVRGVKRFPDNKGHRYLSERELADLGLALRELAEEGANLFGLAIIKLLIFTGARKGEIENLTWSEVDFDRQYLHLGDSKTGQKSLPLNAGALAVIAELPRSNSSELIFPASRGEDHYQGTPKVWRTLRDRAGISDVRLHDLRHSFASIAVSGGASLPIVGALLGHGDVATTKRYAHLQDDPLKSTSEYVGSNLESLFDKSLVEPDVIVTAPKR